MAAVKEYISTILSQTHFPRNMESLRDQYWVQSCLLFYVNDLLSIPTHCKSAFYVDDSKLYLSFPSSDMSTASDNLNADLEHVSRRRCQKSLLINPDKTEVLMIGVPQLLNRLSTVSVRMLVKEIAPSTVAKDLGICIEQSRTCNDHITKTVSTCLHKLVQINRIKHLLDKKTFQ